jgi:hypothetical protein
LEFEVSISLVVLWTVMHVGGCFRFERSWLEVAGIILGVVWILELVASAAAVGLYQ